MVEDLSSSHLIKNITSVVLSSQKKKPLEEDEESTRKSHRHQHSMSYSSTSSGSSTTSSTTHSYVQYFRNKRSFCAQCLMNSALVILLTGYGMPIGFSGILSPKLEESNSSLIIDPETASWIVSVHSIATPFGAILTGPLMDTFGRKTTLQMSIFPMVIGWLLMSLTPNAFFLILGRLLAGFAVGMGPAPSQVLIGEISEPKLRGFFGSTPSASYALGILIVYAMSSIWSWRTVAALGAILPVIAFVWLCFLPESPTWYVNKNRIEEARESLLWLRGGDSEKASHELQALLLLAKTKCKNKQLECPNSNVKGKLASLIDCWWNKLNRPEVKRPFSIIITFAMLQILSGSYIVIFYAVELISTATGNDEKSIDIVKIAVLTAFMRFLVSILVSVLLFFMGRRSLGICSGVGTALASMCIVSYLYCKKYSVQLWGCDIHVSDSGNSTFTIACLILMYVAMNTLGIFSLPMMLMAETLPANVRGIVSGFIVMLVNVFIFATTKVYPYTKNIIGPIGIFSCFSGIALTVAVFIYLYLPETKDRSLTEIEYYFSTGRNHMWITRDKARYKRQKKNKHPQKTISSINLTYQPQ